ncbi:hypothetical protein ACJJTC_014395 [Scirpophaga incertulas]
MNKLEFQQICFDNIKTLCSNYNKDSSSRKTEEYLNKRLKSLQSQWQDFKERNFVLEQELENKNINYFMDGVYEKTKKIYEETKTNMENRLRNLKEQKQNVKFDLTMPGESEFGQQGQQNVQKIIWRSSPLTDLKNGENNENLPTLLQTNMGLINHIQVVHNNSKQGHANFISNLPTGKIQFVTTCNKNHQLGQAIHYEYSEQEEIGYCLPHNKRTARRK